jgi:hypothetical protein
VGLRPPITVEGELNWTQQEIESEVGWVPNTPIESLPHLMLDNIIQRTSSGREVTLSCCTLPMVQERVESNPA